MPFNFSHTVKFALCASALAVTSANSIYAAEHPHEKASSKTKAQSETIVEFEEDLNAHFERHAKKLREALKAAKDSAPKSRFNDRDDEPSTKARVIVKELKKGESGDSHTHTRTKRIEIIENPDELREAAKSLQNMLAESGLLESLADVVIEMADDIELEDTGNGMRLSFNGNRLGGFSVDKDAEQLTLETMGNNTTIEKEVFIENGKKKTRIVIETDSDDVDFDIVPKSKKRSGTEF